MMEPSNGMEAVITKALSGFYSVHAGERTYTCKARGKFRNEHVTPLVGDRVRVTLSGEDQGTVEEILPRKNEFVRPPVANIDKLILVVSRSLPATDPYLLDRMIFIAEVAGCEPVLCFNKCDAGFDGALFDIYSRAGFRVLRTSAESGEGIDRLRETIRGSICAFTGNSGVGKSSILNALEPGLGLPVGDVSDKLGRGRHTTRHVEFYSLGDGTYLADTPGFSSFDIDRMNLRPETDAAAAFREFRPYLGACRYADCSHTKEEGCAVLEAVRRGEISGSRHQSYVKIRDYIRTLKPWQQESR